MDGQRDLPFPMPKDKRLQQSLDVIKAINEREYTTGEYYYFAQHAQNLADQLKDLANTGKLHQAEDLLQDSTLRTIKHDAMGQRTAPVDEAPPTAPEQLPAYSSSSSRKTTRPVRSTRARLSTYNLSTLVGTARHTPAKYLPIHHRNIYRSTEGGHNSHEPSTTPSIAPVFDIDVSAISQESTSMIQPEIPSTNVSKERPLASISSKKSGRIHTPLKRKPNDKQIQLLADVLACVKQEKEWDAHRIWPTEENPDYVDYFIAATREDAKPFIVQCYDDFLRSDDEVDWDKEMIQYHGRRRNDRSGRANPAISCAELVNVLLAHPLKGVKNFMTEASNLLNDSGKKPIRGVYRAWVKQLASCAPHLLEKSSPTLLLALLIRSAENLARDFEDFGINKATETLHERKHACLAEWAEQLPQGGEEEYDALADIIQQEG